MQMKLGTQPGCGPDRESGSGEERLLNVCLLNDAFPPIIDGVSNAVLNYAENITACGGRCTVVTPEYPGAEDRYDFPVVRYHSINTEKLAGYRAGMPFVPSVIGGLGERGFNLIHTHCPIASTLMARSLREVVNAPVILTWHTKFDLDIENSVPTEPLQRLAKQLLIRNVSACDEVWAVSRGAGENLRSMGYEGEIIVMPNGVDLPRGRASEEAVLSLLRETGLCSDKPICLFVGRIMWYKGLKLILDALKQVKEAGFEHQLVFVGDGHDREEVQAYAERLGVGDRCLFTGAIRDRELLRAWYSAADLLLFPSNFDTNGLVVREAAACALASVLLRDSAAAEGVTDGRNGLLIEEDPAALTRVLTDRGTDRGFCRALGERASEELYLSWRDSVSAACDRYRAVLEKWDRWEYHRKHTPSDVIFDLTAEVAEMNETALEIRTEAVEYLRAAVNRGKERLNTHWIDHRGDHQ